MAAIAYRDTLARLRDVNISSPADGESLVYDLASGKWINAVVAGGPGGGDMLAANNLSELTNFATARTNLGLGTAATTAASAYATAAQGALADTALQAVPDPLILQSGAISIGDNSGSNVRIYNYGSSNWGIDADRFASADGLTYFSNSGFVGNGSALTGSPALDGANFTNLQSSVLIGPLPAIDGSALTGLPVISDDAYDEATWNGNLDAPSKNAVRDKFESLSAGGDALTANPLSQFAATTSAQLRTVLSDELGTGAALFDGATPTGLVLTNATGLPQSGVTNLVSDLALKAPLASPTFTGTVTLPASTTFTTPRIAAIHDANGVIALGIATVASQVSSVLITPTISGSSAVGPKISPVSSDTNTAIYLESKGTGRATMQCGALTSAVICLNNQVTITGSTGQIVVTSTGADVTGGLTVSGAFITTPQALTGAGAVNLTTAVTKLTTTGIGQALTLANGTNGQRKTIVYAAEGGGTDTAVLTPTTVTGYATITLTAIGNAVQLIYLTTQGWMVTANYGCTIV